MLSLRLDETKYRINGGYDPILQMRKLELREATLSKLGFESGFLDSIIFLLGELSGGSGPTNSPGFLEPSCPYLSLLGCSRNPVGSHRALCPQESQGLSSGTTTNWRQCSEGSGVRPAQLQVPALLLKSRCTW